MQRINLSLSLQDYDCISCLLMMLRDREDDVHRHCSVACQASLTSIDGVPLAVQRYRHHHTVFNDDIRES